MRCLNLWTPCCDMTDLQNGFITFPAFILILKLFLPIQSVGSSLTKSFINALYFLLFVVLFQIPIWNICWRFGSRTLNRYRSLISISLVSVWEVNFVLFNSMLKYVINRLMHAFFHIGTVIIPRPISTLGLKPSGRYRLSGS
jgi:hypothetical protein